MEVRFGLHRDGLHPEAPKTVVAEITVGPAGMLRLLESDLGLASPQVHSAEEVALYRQCLVDCDDLARFYHNSFQTDPVGVAATLLDWRASWYLHGWNGTFTQDVPQRLADMAAVEASAKDRLPPCEGQRLRRVLRELGGPAATDRRTQIESLTLLDHVDDLPLAWRCLVERLGYETVAEPAGIAHPDSDLGRLQRLLKGELSSTRGSGSKRIPLDGDGSVVVIHAISKDVTAQATAELVRAVPDRQDAVAVATTDGIILDNAFQRVGLPRAGFQHYSPFRAAGQVLKLALALLWTPLDPHRLLQFLIHPVSPLPWRIRAQLAQAVAEQPGIGGPDWRKAMTKIAEADVERGTATSDVAFWATPTRFAPSDGAPMNVLLERTRRCATWLTQSLNRAQSPAAGSPRDEEIAAFATSLAQAQAFAEMLKQRSDSGETHVKKIEVDRLIDEVTKAAPDASTYAEAGHVRATTHPGNVVEPTKTVFWWDLAATRHDLTPIWMRTEVAALERHDVQLPTPSAQLATARRAWLRPVMACTERLVLVVHDDEDTGRHPLWGRMLAELGGWQEFDLDEGLLRGNADVLATARVPASHMAVTPLPGKRRWWHIGRPIGARDKESYTSLAGLCYHPHEWVLGYQAKLQGSRMTGVSDGPLLKGSLAHRLFELFFAQYPDWSTLTHDARLEWQTTAINALIEQEGAVLLEMGRGMERAQLVTTLERALDGLLDHLHAADVTRTEAEKHLESTLGDAMLHGHADLVLTNGQGKRAVLDAKWGSEPYRQREIEGNRHLQLAVYGRLLAEPEWPAVGYFIVTTGNVLATDHLFFPQARAYGTETPREVWQRAQETWRARRVQLGKGQIEVNAGAEPDDLSEPPPGGLDTLVPPNRFDDFTWLTGVEGFQ